MAYKDDFDYSEAIKNTSDGAYRNQLINERAEKENAMNASGSWNNNWAPTSEVGTWKNETPYVPQGAVVQKQGGVNNDYQKYINDAKAEALRAQAIKQQALINQQNSQRPQIEERADNGRSNAYTTSLKSSKKSQDMLRLMGLGYGGYSEDSKVSQLNNMQNAITNLDLQENNALREVDNNIKDIRLNGMITEAELSSKYNEKLAEAIRYSEQMALQDQIRKEDMYSQNAGAYYGDYQAEINKLLASGVAKDDYRILTLQNARQNKIKQQEEEKLKRAQMAYELGNSSYLSEILGFPISTVKKSGNGSGSGSGSSSSGVAKELYDKIFPLMDEYGNAEIWLGNNYKKYGIPYTAIGGILKEYNTTKGGNAYTKLPPNAQRVVSSIENANIESGGGADKERIIQFISNEINKKRLSDNDVIMLGKYYGIDVEG